MGSARSAGPRNSSSSAAANGASAVSGAAGGTGTHSARLAGSTRRPVEEAVTRSDPSGGSSPESQCSASARDRSSEATTASAETCLRSAARCAASARSWSRSFHPSQINVMLGGRSTARNTTASRLELPLLGDPIFVTLVLLEHLQIEDGTSLRQECIRRALERRAEIPHGTDGRRVGLFGAPRRGYNGAACGWPSN